MDTHNPPPVDIRAAVARVRAALDAAAADPDGSPGIAVEDVAHLHDHVARNLASQDACDEHTKNVREHNEQFRGRTFQLWSTLLIACVPEECQAEAKQLMQQIGMIYEQRIDDAFLTGAQSAFAITHALFPDLMMEPALDVANTLSLAHQHGSIGTDAHLASLPREIQPTEADVSGYSPEPFHPALITPTTTDRDHHH